MLVWAVAQTAVPPATEEGLKPPWNHPQEIPLALSRSPTFFPDIAAFAAEAMVQSSNSATGRGSPMIVPLATLSRMSGVVAPWVWPEIRFSAPGVEGPNVVLKELSLMAKRCA